MKAINNIERKKYIVDFEDYGIEGEGIVSVLSCPKCEATAEFYTKIEE